MIEEIFRVIIYGAVLVIYLFHTGIYILDVYAKNLVINKIAEVDKSEEVRVAKWCYRFWGVVLPISILGIPICFYFILRNFRFIWY